MATGISALTAAELSNAAYPGGTPPTGWNAETPASPDGGANSLTVFVNQTTSQIVIAFKGSDNASNFESDFTNSGGSAWETMSPIFAQALANVQAQFPGYDVMTDGHSLGGGMAQTAALEYGLSGYGQNSLPISQTAANDPAITLQGGLTSAINTWVGSGNTFNEVNNAGDPATLLYSTTEGQAYLNTSTTTLDNPYVAAELAGATLSEIPGLNGVGIALAAWGALESHSLITLINNLQAQQGGTTGDSPAANAAATQNANATVSSVEAATPTDNSDGSISITVGNTPQYDFSLGTVGTDAVTYGMSGGGQNIQTVEVIVAGRGRMIG